MSGVGGILGFFGFIGIWDDHFAGGIALVLGVTMICIDRVCMAIEARNSEDV